MRIEEMFPPLEVLVLHEGDTMARGRARWYSDAKDVLEWDCTYSHDHEERMTIQYACANVVVAQCNTDNDLDDVHAMIEQLWTQIKGKRPILSD